MRQTNSNEYQDRVMQEKTALDIKTDKLWEFIKTDTFHNLVHEEQELLNQQYIAMNAYSNCLADRIQLFLPKE